RRLNALPKPAVSGNPARATKHAPPRRIFAPSAIQLPSSWRQDDRPWRPNSLRRCKADLDRHTWCLCVPDHGLVGAHVDNLVRAVAFSGCERKFLVFADFKLLPAAPVVNE